MRAVNRLLAAVVALAVAGACVLIAIEVLVARTGWPQEDPLIVPWVRWRRELRSQTWDQTRLHLICVAAILVGLLLLIAAVCGRERRVRLSSTHPDVEMSTTRAALARALRKEATAVDGIGKARARIRRHTATVRARSDFGAGPQVAQQVEEHLKERLTALAPVPTRTLEVDVRNADRSKR